MAERLQAIEGVVEANVYGVELPGAEGRAGMAGLVVDDKFDIAAFGEHVARELPPYAAMPDEAGWWSAPKVAWSSARARTCARSISWWDRGACSGTGGPVSPPVSSPAASVTSRVAGSCLAERR